MKDYIFTKHHAQRKILQYILCRVVDPHKNVPDLYCEVQDQLLEVVDLKQEIPHNLTPGCWWWVLIGDVDDSPRQSPQLPARIKPNYRQRKVRKTGLSTVELQKAMPELSDLMSAKQSSLAAYVTVCIVLLSFILVPAFLPLTLPPNQCNI